MSPMQWVWLLGILNGLAIGWFSTSSNPGAMRMLGVCLWLFTLFMFVTRFATLVCQ